MSYMSRQNNIIMNCTACAYAFGGGRGFKNKTSSPLQFVDLGTNMISVLYESRYGECPARPNIGRVGLNDSVY